MGFSRPQYRSGLPGPLPGDLPNPGIEPTSLRSPALQVNSLPSEPPGKLTHKIMHFFIFSKKTSVRLRVRFLPGWWELKLCHLAVLRPRAGQRLQLTCGVQAPGGRPLGSRTCPPHSWGSLEPALLLASPWSSGLRYRNPVPGHRLGS